MDFNEISADANLSRKYGDIVCVLYNEDDAIDKFIDIEKTLASCVVEIPNAILNTAGHQDIDKLRIAFRDLRNTTLSFTEPLITARRKDAERIAQLETCYGEVFSKWQCEKKKVEQADTKLLQLTTQTIEQSNYCANLGAVMGTLLWKSSKFPQMTNIWLNDNHTKMGEFLSIINTTFTSFIDTFTLNFPPLHNDECQFVMSLMGTITNITSTPLGRQFIINHENGKILIKQLIKSLPLIPKQSGDAMKRLILMILYNTSLNRVGLPFLLELKVDEIVGPCIDDESMAIDLQVPALRLIQSLTYNLTDPHILQRIIDSIPYDRIQLLATSMTDDNELPKIAQEVIDNIFNSRANADTVSQVTSSTDNN